MRYLIFIWIAIILKPQPQELLVRIKSPFQHFHCKIWIALLTYKVAGGKSDPFSIRNVGYLVNIFRFKARFKSLFIWISNPISAGVRCMYLLVRKEYFITILAEVTTQLPRNYITKLYTKIGSQRVGPTSINFQNQEVTEYIHCKV